MSSLTTGAKLETSQDKVKLMNIYGLLQPESQQKLYLKNKMKTKVNLKRPLIYLLKETKKESIVNCHA